MFMAALQSRRWRPRCEQTAVPLDVEGQALPAGRHGGGDRGSLGAAATGQAQLAHSLGGDLLRCGPAGVCLPLWHSSVTACFGHWE